MSQDKKVVSVNERIPTLQEKRKQKANRRILAFVLLFFLLIVVLVYFQSPLSGVKTIHIDGNQLVADETILKASGLEEGMNIWHLSEGEREKAITSLKEIESAKIERELPVSVRITVSEYPRVGYVADGDTYLPLLQNGETLDPIPNGQLVGDAPVLVGFNDDDDVLAQLGEELVQTAPEIVGRISEILFTPTSTQPSELTLYMTDGNEVKTNVESFAQSMQPYPQVAAQLDPEKQGVLYMKMSPYFKETEHDSQ
ncbi:cell division protein FtsQ/DivIB [Shouchella clausii]|uniref:cell division protein FtsQ/DivIB n=1 Tax=Shouchella TaxID=2893057 RepID=UPI000794CB89|nr:FtsQ-type POTRA domain-containing protein [Shouchella clausii]MCM3312284.1 FtsQ-type POTRA domain-containing protein [Psychrobacillus sp. MER TA 17]KKI84602.1 hypothetical protein WZ76_20355 [Shouchella clausii]MDO7282272.1 FtsQ-type POTRA domain-containing protein [Shouchella clausii]MDO7302367.1 FtsQ-type POTRA domain-containing protein [Shouchella clausii]PAD19380.1 hypothetical protein CHH73_01820 [Shouchella clausii]